MSEWQPIETLKSVDLAIRKRGVILTAFDPSDHYEDGTVGPQYIRWGNGPHTSEQRGEVWLDFDSGNYSPWKPRPTHWMHLPPEPKR